MCLSMCVCVCSDVVSCRYIREHWPADRVSKQQEGARVVHGWLHAASQTHKLLTTTLRILYACYWCLLLLLLSIVEILQGVCKCVLHLLVSTLQTGSTRQGVTFNYCKGKTRGRRLGPNTWWNAGSRGCCWVVLLGGAGWCCWVVQGGVAGWCRVLLSGVEWCCVLLSVAECCWVLLSVAEWCWVVLCVANCFCVVLCVAECCWVVLSVSVWCCVLLSGAEWCWVVSQCALFYGACPPVLSLCGVLLIVWNISFLRGCLYKKHIICICRPVI